MNLCKRCNGPIKDGQGQRYHLDGCEHVTERECRESLRARLAEAEKASEWRDAILGLVATWPEYKSLPWGGNKSGWGFVFEMLKLVHKRLAEAEATMKLCLERASSEPQDDLRMAVIAGLIDNYFNGSEGRAG